MSALTEAGLFHLEAVARTEADRIRFRNPEADLSSPSISADAKTHVANERRRADDFDQIGNLLCGLQADWAELGPKVRAGFVRQRKEYEAIKDAAQAQTEGAA